MGHVLCCQSVLEVVCHGLHLLKLIVPNGSYKVWLFCLAGQRATLHILQFVTTPLTITEN